MRKLAVPALFLGLLVLPGCLTTRETFTVHAGGSIDVEARAEGQVGDLSTGFMIPMDAGWAPATTETTRWIAEVGRDVGSPELKDRIESSEWLTDLKKRDAGIPLAVTRTFPSANALPRQNAPEGTLYRSAHLLRSATFTKTQRGGKTLITFERVVHRRDGLIERFWGEFRDVGNEVQQKFDGGADLTTAELRKLAESLKRAAVRSNRWYVQEALGALYTQGGANLSLTQRGHVVGKVESAIQSLLDDEVMARAARLMEQHARNKRAGRDTNETGEWFAAKEKELRSTLRKALADSLARTDLPETSRNGVLHRLEWLIASTDHTDDLLDETFEFVVNMPGTIVSGNFHETRDDGSVVWVFKGRELLDGDLVVHVVSVIE